MEKAWGPYWKAEVYRCENCKALYLSRRPARPEINVAGQGMLSVFGLTPPKEK